MTKKLLSTTLTLEFFWFSEDKAYEHASGMKYDLDSKNYTTWVNDDPNDLRCLHYLHFQGILKFVMIGKRGEMNNKVLRDND